MKTKNAKSVKSTETAVTSPPSAVHQNSILMKMQQDPFFRSGYLYQMAGNFTAAAACYSRSIQAGPSAEAHTLLGWVLSLMGELEGAIFQARKAIEINPEFGNAWNDLGSYLLDKFSFDEAIDCFNKALTSKNKDNAALVHFNLGRAYLCKGMLIGAMKSLEESAGLDPGFAPTQALLEQLRKQLH